ncbi:MAG: O-methyltransferase [bacterium]|nr:O-methyltransferase [bacterium]
MSLHPESTRYLESLEPALPDYLMQIKEYGLSERVPIVSDEVGAFLQLLTSLKTPKRILELGSGISYSTHWMLLGAPSAHLVALDCNADRVVLSRAFLAGSGFLAQVELREQWIEEYFDRQGAQIAESFDFIFMDSTKKDYANLLASCYKALAIDGLLVVDNVFYSGKVLQPPQELTKKYSANVAAMKAFNANILEHPGFRAQFLALGDGLLVARKLA